MFPGLAAARVVTSPGTGTGRRRGSGQGSSATVRSTWPQAEYVLRQAQAALKAGNLAAYAKDISG